MNGQNGENQPGKGPHKANGGRRDPARSRYVVWDDRLKGFGLRVEPTGRKTFIARFPAYCAVALAGLDDLPDTIRARSVIIRMRRHAPHEHVEPYRRRIHMPAGNALRNRLAGWAASIADTIAETWPEMPPGIEDRNADVWEPLLAVADAAGGDWPVRARAAAVALVTASQDDTPSLGIRLLSDLRDIFGDRISVPTADILEALHRIDDAPWSDIRGKTLDARGLSTRLRRYQVKRRDLRTGTWHGKCYAREDLHDAWARYLGPLPDKSVTSVTLVTDKENRGLACHRPETLSPIDR